jgi:hypothetical protein
LGTVSLLQDKLLDRSLPKLPYVPETKATFTHEIEYMVNMNRSVTTEIEKMAAKFINFTLKKTMPSNSKNPTWDREF